MESKIAEVRIYPPLEYPDIDDLGPMVAPEQAYRVIRVERERLETLVELFENTTRASVQRAGEPECDPALDLAIQRFRAWFCTVPSNESVTVEYPANWWDAFKLQYLQHPRIRHWFPVEYTRETFSARAFFPVGFPEQGKDVPTGPMWARANLVMERRPRWEW